MDIRLMDSNPEYYGAGRPGEGWRRLARRSVLIPLAGFFVLAVGGWVVFSIARGDGQKEGALDAAIKASDNAFQAGDYKKSSEELKKVIGQADTKEEKIALYSSLAAAAASAGRMSEAIDYMEKKHAFVPETAKSDAYLMGTYYERTGDTAKAIKQYKIALSYNKSLPKGSATDAKIKSLEARIKSLGE
jgi:tetratricopeptide (TPR) repeat protein